MLSQITCLMSHSRAKRDDPAGSIKTDKIVAHTHFLLLICLLCTGAAFFKRIKLTLRMRCVALHAMCDCHRACKVLHDVCVDTCRRRDCASTRAVRVVHSHACMVGEIYNVKIWKTFFACLFFYFNHNLHIAKKSKAQSAKHLYLCQHHHRYMGFNSRRKDYDGL